MVICFLWINEVAAQTILEKQQQLLLNELAIVSSTRDSLPVLIELSELYKDLDSKKGEEYGLLARNIAENWHDQSLLLLSKLHLASNLRMNSKFDDAMLECREIAVKAQNYPPIKAAAFHELGTVFQLLHQHDSALNYFDKSIELYRQLNDTIMISWAKAYQSSSLTRIGRLHEALDLAESAVNVFRRFGEREKEAVALNFLGSVNVSLGQMTIASDYLFRALAIADSLGNPRLQMNQLNELGIIYAVQGDNEESLVYFNKSLEMAEKINSHRDYTGTLSNIAYIYSVLKQPNKSLEYYGKVLDHNATYGNECLSPFIYEGIARLFESIDQPDSAIVYYQEVLELSKRCQMMEFQISSLQGIGRHYQKKGNTGAAIRNFLKSFQLAHENNFIPLAHLASKELYQAYKLKGDYPRALEFHELMVALDDSIYSENNKSEILRLTARYEFEKEKQLLEARQEREELQYQEDLKRQVLTRNYAFAGLALTVLLIGTLYWLYRNKQKSNAQLAKLNQEKNELIGVVAHDLRNPLNNINNLSALLKEGLNGKLSKDQVDYFRFIENSSARMNDLIERVLDVNAIESESLKMNLQVCDLAEILNTVADSFVLRASEKHIDMKRELPENKYYAFIDRNYSIQVFENLLSNALKFSPEKSCIEVKLDEEDHTIVASIIDEGPGFSQEDKKQLFKRFAKLSARPTGKESSVGLGLSIVKRYVDAMNGHIEAISNNGKGTIFRVQFGFAKA